MLPTSGDVLSAMVVSSRGDRGAQAAGARLDQAATGGLGIGQADELVADDVVRETERALEDRRGHRGLGDEVEDRVVALGLVLDLVGEAALAPPVGLAVHLATAAAIWSVTVLIQPGRPGRRDRRREMTMNS